MTDEGFAIDEFHFNDPRYRQLIARGVEPILWTEQELISRIVRPAPRTSDLMEFCGLSLVQHVITNNMKTAFSHLLRIQGFEPTISAYDLVHVIKYGTYESVLKLVQFLLPFVVKNKTASWLWKAPNFLVTRWEWWYLLRQNGFRANECFYTGQMTNTAYRQGLEIWQMQRQTVLALFVCVRRVYGSRDMARAIATLVINQCWIYVYLICGPRWPRR